MFMEQTKKWFTTGEFAQACGVKKQTLFHYDAIGLLKPEHKNANGYRYYGIQQTELFSVIDMLKDIGMSLYEIKDFLHFKSPEEAIELLTEKQQAMHEKIANMQRTVQIIENKRLQIEASLHLDFSTFSIEQLPEEYYVLSENILNCSDKAFAKHIMAFIRYTRKKSLDIGHPIGGLIKPAQLSRADYWNYAHFYMRIAKPTTTLTALHIREAGCFAVGYHQGSFRNIHDTYKQLKAWIHAEKYVICGNSYEEFVVDEVSVTGEENYVTKIMIQVKQQC
ncbi:multidrug-efflux transporter 2 regulator [Lysinibacillus alkalisoli]|uniref:Multidrug-efflux transporter 2 regulator n=2 Tax=Lysinibacillus alkalisoli TaxID=1911548 RepID=A0A917G5M9_9BACI|nr:multidrug-efflux transporter 2 regulator [Lysinibacillus alkalisoli]